MQSLWYLRAGGHTQGPFPLAQLIQYVELGRLGRQDLVSQDGIHWKTIAETEQFEAALEIYAKSHARSGVSDNDEIDWARERALARVRWADEREEHAQPSADRPNARAAEPSALLALRHAHQETETLTWLGLKRRLGARHALAVVGVLILLAAVIWYGQSRQPEPAITPSLLPRANCTAPPAAEVAWQDCDKRSANLVGVNLKGARLDGARMDAADLRQADLSYANLNGTSLRGANLSGAQLIGADLRGADLTGADLSAAILEYATLTGALMTGARLAGTRLGKAVWPDGRVCAPQSVDVCL